jgi:hypothetical protein
MKLGRNIKSTAQTVRIDLITYGQMIRTFTGVLQLFNIVFDSVENIVQCHAAAELVVAAASFLGKNHAHGTIRYRRKACNQTNRFMPIK